MPSISVAPLVTTATPTTRTVPTIATTCSIRFSRARTRATCSLMRAPQLGHTPPRLTTRSASHSGHSIFVRSGIEKTLRGAAAIGKAGQGAEQRPLVEDPRAAVRMQRADGRETRPPALLIFVLRAPYARALRSLRTGRF